MAIVNPAPSIDHMQPASMLAPCSKRAGVKRVSLTIEDAAPASQRPARPSAEWRAMPDATAKAYVEKREAMLAECEALHRTRTYVPLEKRSEGLGDTSLPAQEGNPEGSELECPMMSPAELQAITVWVTDVFADGGEGLRKVLATHGCAVIRDTVSEEENAVMEKLWAADLAALAEASVESHFTTPEAQKAYAKFMEEGIESWPLRTLYSSRQDPTPKRGLMHGGYAWAARRHPNVKRVFAAALEEEEKDLCVGMERVFFRPCDHTDAKTSDQHWMHTDYNTNLQTRVCYQSILYTWGSEKASDSTTVVWPGSHIDICDEISADSRAVRRGKNYVEIAQLENLELRERLLKDSRRHGRRVPMAPGSLLMFDARLVHQGWEGGKRLAMPICWEATKHRKPEALNRKLWLAATGLPSTHWASNGVVTTSFPLLVKNTSPASDEEGVDHHEVNLSLYPSVVPFGVRADRVQEWQKLMPSLWCKFATESADAQDWSSVLSDVLDRRVLDLI
eukprot:Rhum_TRINITY_DN11730_c0_g1::Rhum_TRINITY_DN11730_c0_g1_i1::g.46759::m.46759